MGTPKQEQKEKYKTLITNFASLSEAFSQKAENEDSDDPRELCCSDRQFKISRDLFFQKAFSCRW